MRSCFGGLAAVSVSWALCATLVGSQVCGDVDSTGNVTAGDALAVLKVAVGQDVTLHCASGECSALEQRVANIERSQFKVIDADDHTLGTFVSAGILLFGASHWDIVPEGAHRLLRLVLDGELSATAAQFFCNELQVYYASSDCTGEAYVEIDPTDSSENAAFIRVLGECANGDTIIDAAQFFEPTEPAADGITLRSYAVSDQFFPAGCVATDEQTDGGRFYAAVEVLKEFPRHIRLPLRIERTAAP